MLATCTIWIIQILVRAPQSEGYKLCLMSLSISLITQIVRRAPLIYVIVLVIMEQMRKNIKRIVVSSNNTQTRKVEWEMDLDAVTSSNNAPD